MKNPFTPKTTPLCSHPTERSPRGHEAAIPRPQLTSPIPTPPTHPVKRQNHDAPILLSRIPPHDEPRRYDIFVYDNGNEIIPIIWWKKSSQESRTDR
mmetsp:Transcript_2278/g.4342  ORF Transcript_2278/g.4342 Transcript_2278/m.4342 type:complete len:97 (-) Transcript_2278:83-373(-)